MAHGPEMVWESPSFQLLSNTKEDLLVMGMVRGVFSMETRSYNTQDDSPHGLEETKMGEEPPNPVVDLTPIIQTMEEQPSVVGVGVLIVRPEMPPPHRG